jgi:signal transduction histidine kinase
VKESLNNIIKHAKATNAGLDIQIVRNILIIEIKDNGKGIPVTVENTNGNGLKNINRRMNMIKGKLHIFNSNGTTVRLELDLPTYPNV